MGLVRRRRATARPNSEHTSATRKAIYEGPQMTMRPRPRLSATAQFLQLLASSQSGITQTPLFAHGVTPLHVWPPPPPRAPNNPAWPHHDHGCRYGGHLEFLYSAPHLGSSGHTSQCGRQRRTQAARWMSLRRCSRSLWPGPFSARFVLGSPPDRARFAAHETYQSRPCRVWIEVRNPASIAVQRERSEIWNRSRARRR
jgi:hypothetical protein